MAYFPMYINLSEKKCVIVGGGIVALRKIQTLQKFGAEIVVIAPEICDEIKDLLSEKSLYLREVQETDLEDATLVIAATNQRKINHTIALWCKKENIPVNVIDAPEECTFLFPSVVSRGDVCIGINTAGQSPVVSKHIRQEIEKVIPEEYADITVQLGNVKAYVKQHISKESDRRKILREIAAVSFEKGRSLTESELQEYFKNMQN